MMADLVRDDIGLGKVAGRTEPALEFVEESGVDINLLIGRDSRKAPSPPAPRRSPTGCNWCRLPASSAGIAAPGLLENLRPTPARSSQARRSAAGGFQASASTGPSRLRCRRPGFRHRRAGSVRNSRGRGSGLRRFRSGTRPAAGSCPARRRGSVRLRPGRCDPRNVRFRARRQAASPLSYLPDLNAPRP